MTDELILEPDLIILPSGDIISVSPGYNPEEDDQFIGAIIGAVAGISSAIIKARRKKKDAQAAQAMQSESIAEEERYQLAVQRDREDEIAKARIFQTAQEQQSLLDKEAAAKKKMILYGGAGLGSLVLGLAIYFMLFKK